MEREDEPVVEYEGAARRVLWARDAAGRMRGREHFLSRDTRTRAKLRALIERLGDHPDGIRNEEKFRNEGDGIWAIKSFQDRLYCFFVQHDLYIAHGVVKKRDRARPQDIEVAKAVRHHQTQRAGRDQLPR